MFEPSSKKTPISRNQKGFLTFSQGAERLAASTWGPNWCFHIFYDSGFWCWMMIYENFIFCLNAKKFLKSSVICKLFPTVHLWRPPKFIGGILTGEVWAKRDHFLGHNVKRGHKNVVDPPSNDGICCSFNLPDSLSGIKQA